MYDPTLTPLPETPEFIQEKLQEFQDELGREVPPDSDVDCGEDELPAHAQAALKCATLVSDEFKLVFLRSEWWVVKDTVELWVKYWAKRLEIFGPEKAFLPLTMEKGGALEDVAQDIVEIMKLCQVQILDGVYDPLQRGITALHLTGELSQYDPNVVLKATWYMGHVALEDENVQRRGMIFLVQPKFASMNEFRNTPLAMLSGCLQGVFPLNVAVCHMINPPFIFSFLYGILSMIIGKRLSDRIIVHSGEVTDQLSNHGLDATQIPVMFGGEIETNALSSTIEVFG